MKPEAAVSEKMADNASQCAATETFLAYELFLGFTDDELVREPNP